MHSGNLIITISISGQSFTGSGTVTGVKELAFDETFGLNCIVVNIATYSGSASGIITGGGSFISRTIDFGDPDLIVNIVYFTGSIIGNTITGTLSGDGSGSFSLTKQ